MAQPRSFDKGKGHRRSVGSMQMKDFKQADRVKHLKLGCGVVASIRHDEMIVIFDDRGSDGSNIRGIYDDVWFRINDDLLRKI
jgi:hypothetical protein